MARTRPDGATIDGLREIDYLLDRQAYPSHGTFFAEGNQVPALLPVRGSQSSARNEHLAPRYKVRQHFHQQRWKRKACRLGTISLPNARDDSQTDEVRDYQLDGPRTNRWKALQ